jgi:hypothetical protein
MPLSPLGLGSHVRCSGLVLSFVGPTYHLVDPYIPTLLPPEVFKHLGLARRSSIYPLRRINIERPH